MPSLRSDAPAFDVSCLLSDYGNWGNLGGPDAPRLEECAMPRRGELTISKRTVDRLSVEGREAVFWDRKLPGFGVRVYPSGSKSYLVQSRGPRGIRRVSLGRHGETTAEEARRRPPPPSPRIKQDEDLVADTA